MAGLLRLAIFLANGQLQRNNYDLEAQINIAF